MVRVPEWSRRPRSRFYALLTVFVVALAGWAWFLQSGNLDRADKWSSIAAFGWAVAVAAIPGFVWLWRRDASPEAPTDAVAAAVARLVQAQYEQWTAEEAARQFMDPYPLPVRWRVSARAEAVMASWAAVRGRPGGGPVPLEGSLDQIAAVFTAPESPRRLVVLGAPGAGKSVLVLRLTVDLLTAAHKEIGQDQELTGPIPVMVPIGGWDPREPLAEWIADRLAEVNPSLRQTVAGPDGKPRSLARAIPATSSTSSPQVGSCRSSTAWTRSRIHSIRRRWPASRRCPASCRNSS